MSDITSNPKLIHKLSCLDWPDFICLFNILCRRPVFIDFSSEISRLKEIWEHEELRESISRSLLSGRIPQYLFPDYAPHFNVPDYTQHRKNIVLQYLAFLDSI